MKRKIGFFGGGKMAEGILAAIADRRSVIVAERVPRSISAISPNEQ